MKKQTIIALKIILTMTIITGVLYPLLITTISQIAFNHKANGSMIKNNGVIIGSELIGQKFDSTIYFWSRPSAVEYNPLPSGGSNYGPTSDKLKKLMLERKTKFTSGNTLQDSTTIPVEMLTASASGLDPHIPPKAALMQIGRIAKARNFDASRKQRLVALVNEKMEKPQWGLFGEERINVLLLNLELDKIK
jgi:potassium-transporting ATPase KdpC subunit